MTAKAVTKKKPGKEVSWPKPKVARPDREMKVERVAVTTLSEDPKNARKHPDRNLDAIKASLTRFGQQKPIVVDGNGVVVAGNGTLRAALALGWTEIDIVRTPLVDKEAAAFAIADNRTAERAEWDLPLLAEALRSMDQPLDFFTEEEMRFFSAGGGEQLLDLGDGEGADPQVVGDRITVVLAELVNRDEVWSITVAALADLGVEIKRTW